MLVVYYKESTFGLSRHVNRSYKIGGSNRPIADRSWQPGHCDSPLF